MAKISELAGLSVKHTNHSLRATSASRMFSSGVPEKIVAEVTGHKSLTALRQYERTTETQYQAVGQSITHMEEFKAVCAASKDVDVRTLHAERARKVEVAQETCTNVTLLSTFRYLMLSCQLCHHHHNVIYIHVSLLVRLFVVDNKFIYLHTPIGVYIYTPINIHCILPPVEYIYPIYIYYTLIGVYISPSTFIIPPW